MGELLWSKEEEVWNWDSFVSIAGRSPEVIRSKTSLFRNETNVALVDSKYVGGRNKNGKIYVRWIPVSRLGIRQNHKGTLIPFWQQIAVRRNNGWVRCNQWSSEAGFGALFTPMPVRYFINVEDYPYYQLRKAVKEVYGVEQFRDIFPIWELAMRGDTNALNPFHVIPPAILHAMRNENFADFVREVFGKSRYRKDLVKAASEVVDAGNLNLIAFMSQFRDLAPTDWIIRGMRERPLMLHDYGRLQTKNLRLYFKAINPRSFRFLLRDEIPQYVAHNISVDRAGCYHRYNIDRNLDRDRVFRSWEEFHEVIMPEYRAGRRGLGRLEVIPPPPNEAYKFKGLKVDLHDVEVDGFHFEVALCTRQMELWSDKMRNCIQSYKNDVHDIFGAVYLKDKLVANYQLSQDYRSTRKNKSWRVVQLYGPCNQTTSDSLQEAFEKLMTKNNVTCDRYGGRHRRVLDAPPENYHLPENLRLAYDLPF